MTSRKSEIKLCALPGCAELIETGEGQKPRKFCCAAHRAIARQRRREAEELNALDSAGPPRLVDIDMIDFDNPAEPDADQMAGLQSNWTPPLRSSRAGSTAAATDAGATSTGRSRWPAAAGDDIPTDGSERVRRLGRGRNRPTGPGQQRPEDRRHRAARRRTQTIALIGALGILAGGGGYSAITAKNTNSGRSGVSNSPAITPVAAAEWAKQAEQSLQSVERQLNLIAQVKAEWLSSAAGRSGGAMPSIVQAMFDRETVLLQAKTTIASQLTAYKSMGEAASQLASAQAELDRLDKVIQATPTGPSAQPKPQDAQVEQQRVVWQRQRDANSAAVVNLGTSVQQAMNTGLPNPAEEETTKQLGDSVLDLARGTGDPNRAPGQGRQAPTSGIAPREREGDARPGVGTGAPPQRGEPPFQLDDSGTGGAGGGPADDAVRGFSGGGSAPEALPVTPSPRPRQVPQPAAEHAPTQEQAPQSPEPQAQSNSAPEQPSLEQQREHNDAALAARREARDTADGTRTATEQHNVDVHRAAVDQNRDHYREVKDLNARREARDAADGPRTPAQQARVEAHRDTVDKQVAHQDLEERRALRDAADGPRTPSEQKRVDAYRAKVDAAKT